MTGIGTLTEKSLHAALKDWYAEPQDQFEVQVDGFVIDIVRDDLLIEIQTGNFGAMKRKLNKLLADHSIRLLHPIAAEKWIVRQSAAGAQIGRRKSPKQGSVIDLFAELVYLPHLIDHPNLVFEVLLTQEEEVWRNDGQGSWRRKRWSIHDRRLLNVIERVPLSSVADLCQLLPASLQPPFTNRQLADSLKCRMRLAQKITYTLRHCGGLELAGKKGNALLYNLTK
jgi:hypothetical protein